MKISYSILKQYCDVPLEPEKLSELLTNHGIKVERLELLNNGDSLFESEITANRPDCLSFIGIAREVALLTKRPFHHSRPKSARSGLRSPKIPFIQINNPKLCPIYIGRIIRNIKVASSPDWLRLPLETIGFRSINNIVDITNFVMMETGQPLHAFDLDKLNGKQIIVRIAKMGEKIVAIDGKTYELSPETLVIADATKAVAIAGIMGSKDTEVTEDTKNILLESAYFQGANIRGSSRYLALSSDSSYRFERGVDPHGVEVGSQRASELILELASGELTDYQSLDFFNHKERRVVLRLEHIKRILGASISLPEIKRILKRLGFITKKSNNKMLELIIPSFRQDINLEIDVIEELARVRGYDRIPATAPGIELKTSEEDKLLEVMKTTRSLFVEAGYNEVLTNSFWDIPRFGAEFADKEVFSTPNSATNSCIGLLDTKGKIDRYLRTNLNKGLLDVFYLNENYLRGETQKVIKLFEISKIYLSAKHQNDKTITEKFHLGLLDTDGFYSVKGAISELFMLLGISDKISYSLETNNDKNTVAVFLQKKNIGYLGALGQAGICELDFESIVQEADLAKKYQVFPRLPTIRRDLAIVVSENTPWQEIEKTTREAMRLSAQETPLEKIEFFDLYRGKQVKEGHKSIAFSLTFRHPEKTLSNEGVDAVVKTVVSVLEKNLQASLRTPR
jgi:phenylalanyl-tRNA synthetase beta chain